jgi:hypothetical protein
VRAKVVLGTGVIVCDIVSENEKSIRVMLPNGKVIKRKKDRDIISYLEEDDATFPRYTDETEQPTSHLL